MKQNIEIINKTFLRLDDAVININHICRLMNRSSGHTETIILMACDGVEAFRGHKVTATVSEITAALREMGEL